MTTTFFRDRGLSLALVILIMFAVSLGQTGISYTMAFGALSAVLPRDRSGIATSLAILRFSLVGLMAVLWALRRKHALFHLIVIANALRLLRWELFSFRRLRRRLAYDLEIPDLMDQ